MNITCLLSVFSFLSFISFSQVPKYAATSGLSNTVVCIQEVGNSNILLIADKSANIILWNPSSERSLASYKSVQDELIEVLDDEEYIILVGNLGLEFFDKEELLRSLRFEPIFRIEQDDLSDGFIDGANRMLWLSSYSGQVYRLNLDIPENDFLEEVYFADEFTKSIHVKDNIIQIKSPFARTIIELDPYAESRVILAEKLEDSEHLNPLNTDNGLIGGSATAIQNYPSDSKSKITHIRDASLSSALCLVKDQEAYLIGDRDGRLRRINNKGNQEFLFHDSTTTISAVYSNEETIIFGDYFGRVYRMSKQNSKARLVLNPSAATEMNGVYMLPNERMLTTHLNLNGSYVRIWRLEMAELEAVISVPSYEITDVSWTMNGDSLILIHANSEVNLIHRKDGDWNLQQRKEGEVAFIPGAALVLMDKNKFIKRSDAIEYWNSAKSYSQEFRLNRSESEFVEITIHGMNSSELPHPNIIEELFIKAEMGEWLEKWDILDRDIFVMKLYRSENLEVFKQRVANIDVSDDQLEAIYNLAHKSGTEFHFNTDKFKRIVNLESTPDYFDWSPDGRFAIFYFQEYVVIHDLQNELVDTLAVKLEALQLYPSFGNDKCALANRITAEIYLFMVQEQGFEQFRCLPYGLRSYLFINRDGFFKQYGPAASITAQINGENLSFEQVDLYYNRPHLLLKSLNAPASEIEFYQQVFKRRLLELQLSEIELTEPSSQIIITSPELENAPYEVYKTEFTCSIEHKMNEELMKIHVLVNGVPAVIHISSDNRISFSLQPGINQIELYAKYRDGSESKRIVRSIYGNFEEVPSRTFFVGLATNSYEQPGHNLKFVENDIRAVDSMLNRNIDEDYESYLFLGKEWNPEILGQLRSILEKATVNDRIIVAFSGHGLLNSDQEFFLSTHVVDFSNPESGGIAYDSLIDLFDGLNCRNRLVLLDACHSGLIDKQDGADVVEPENLTKQEGAKGDLFTKLVQKNRVFEVLQSDFAKLNGRGVQVITAAGGADFAYEDPKLKYSYFTKAILEFLGSEGDHRVNLLREYVDKRVPELSGGRQRPTSREENILLNWSLD